jgi:hypothetical protein
MRFKLNLKLVVIALIGLSFLSAFGLTNSVLGADRCETPSGCTCSGNNTVELDFSCNQRRLLSPNFDCSLFKCSNLLDFSQTFEGDENQTIKNLVNIFGVRINARGGKVLQTLIFVGFSLFLSVVSLALMFYGLWASYLRARADSDADVEKASKMIRNAAVGLGLIALSLVFAQLTASFLGLGSINEMVDFSNLTLRQNDPT